MRNLENLKERTKIFALGIIRLYGSLPKKVEAQVIGKQLLRSGTSVGAQFREGIHSKSRNDLISKLDGVLQELEETQYWLELLRDAEIFSVPKLEPLYNETKELTAIFTAISKNQKKLR